MTDPIATGTYASDFPLTSASRLMDRAGGWFLHSGIQEPAGGVARYYRSDINRNHRISTEITGYAASTLVYLWKLSGDSRYLEAARKAGRFLTRIAWDPVLETFPFEYDAENRVSSPVAYFFDCGIIARGLLSLWRATGEAEFLEAAKACGRSMARDFAGNPEFRPILSLPSKQPVPGDRRWSRKPGCYQLKSAMAWHELFEETHGEEFRRSYETVLGHSLRTEATFLDGEPEKERVMDRLHAYCYFLEGLIPYATRPDCARVISEGIVQVGRRLREIAPGFVRSDVYAQLLRMRLLAASMGIAPIDLHSAAEEAASILDFQHHSPDPRIHGGFCFGRRGSELLPYVNPVSTALCLQAAIMWSQYQASQFRPAPQDLL